MSLTSRLGLSLALSLIAGLGAPLMAPVVLSNAATSNRFASSLVQTQTVQAQTVQAQATQAQATQAQTPAFSDVSADYWAHDYIQGLAKSNVISGFSDGTFRPNEPVTRAQFAAILRQAFLQSQPTTAQAFKDVPAGYWAKDAIASARSAGFLSGYPDNTFKPNDRILRVQALISLANGLEYPAGSPQSLSKYKDADTVPTYARPSPAAAAQANLVVSYPAPDQLSPNISASRAEVAAFVYQELVKAGRVSPIAARPERRWQITPITTIEAKTNHLSLSENGQRLAALTNYGPINDSHTIQVWNTQTGSLLKTLTAGAPDSFFAAIAISKDGTQIAFTQTTASTGAMQLTVQTVEDGKVLLTRDLLPPENQRPTGTGENNSIAFQRLNVVFSPDGKQVMTEVALIALNDIGIPSPISYYHLDFQNIATGEVTQFIELEAVSGSKKPILSPDGSLLAIPNDAGTDSTSQKVDIFRQNNNNQFVYLRALPISLHYFGDIEMTFTNSNLLNLTTLRPTAVLDIEAVLDTWNPQTGEQVQSTALPNESCINLQGFTPSPDGTSYFASYPTEGICLGNIYTGELQRNLDGLSVVGLEPGVFSGDGNSVAVAGDREIRIFTKAAP